MLYHVQAMMHTMPMRLQHGLAGVSYCHVVTAEASWQSMGAASACMFPEFKSKQKV